jgi:hypothetical protein
MTGAAAIETHGLMKDFERGRRTLFQRLRREPDRRERFRAVDGIDLRVEHGETLAIARKEILVELRYPLNAVNEVLQPLYQFLIPSLLLGAAFLVGGRAIGLRATTGTEDLAGFLFVGVFIGGLISATFWGAGVQLQARDGRRDA